MIPLGWAEFSTRIKLGQFASKLVKHARSEVPICEWWGFGGNGLQNNGGVMQENLR